MKRSLKLTGAGFLLAFVPLSAPGSAYAETCNASWYGPGFHGNKMANGKRFDMGNPSIVAHSWRSLGTRIKIKNLRNGKTLVATVTDRGPNGVRGRCVDLSKAAAKKLGALGAGIVPVSVTVLK